MRKSTCIALLTLLITSIKAVPCDCIDFTLEEAIPRTEIIIRGSFISVKHGVLPLLEDEREEDRLFPEGIIIVIEVLKGRGMEVGDTIQVVGGFSSCSKYYKNKREYLFFASRKDSGIESDACSYTTEIIDVDKNKWYRETKAFLRNE